MHKFSEFARNPSKPNDLTTPMHPPMCGGQIFGLLSWYAVSHNRITLLATSFSPRLPCTSRQISVWNFTKVVLKNICYRFTLTHLTSEDKSVSCVWTVVLTPTDQWDPTIFLSHLAVTFLVSCKIHSTWLVLKPNRRGLQRLIATALTQLVATA